MSRIPLEKLVYEAGREPGRDDMSTALRRYRAILDPAPVGHLLLDPHGLVLEANAAARQLTGGALLCGMPLSSRVATRADELALARHLLDVFASRERRACEIRIKRADGGTARARLESMADPHQQLCLAALIELGPGRVDPGAVLVVEDERLVRMAVRYYLETSGYQVLEADGVDDAVAACHDRGEPPATLVTDVILPTASGPELASRLSQAIPGLRVVYISAHPKDLLVDTRRIESTDELLQKPFSKAELLAVLEGS